MSSEAPTRLRYDSLDEALGVGPDAPRLSWLVSGTDAQLAYELEATLAGETWRSGRIESVENAFVDYAGPLPGSGERLSWRVRVFTGRGASNWSGWA